MTLRKKKPVEGYFNKNAKKIICFADKFADILCDDEIIGALAQKDLEKLAKVWKLALEMLLEHSEDKSRDKLAELIGAYRDIDESGGSVGGEGDA